MASESLVVDLSIHELHGEKKVGDDTKEEEKYESEDVSFGYETKMEEGREQVGEKNKSLQEPQVFISSEPAVETNERKSNDIIQMFTSKEPINSEFKNEDLKDAEVVSATKNEVKSEKEPLISTFESETLEATNPDSSKKEVGVGLIKKEDAEDYVRESVRAEAPTILVHDTSERPEDNDVYTNTLDSIKVPVKDLEVQSSSSEKQKLEESAETKIGIELIKSENEMDEVEDVAPVKIAFDASKAPEKNDVNLVTPPSIEVPVNDPDVVFCTPEEKKQEEVAEERNDFNSIAPTTIEVAVEDPHVDFSSEVKKQEEGEGKNDVDSIVPTTIEVPVKGPHVDFSSPEEKKQEEGAEGKNYVDLIALISIEVPFNDPNVDFSSLEEQKQAEGAEIKDHIELMGPEDSKKEVQELVPTKVAVASEEPQKDDVGSSALTTIEVPVVDLQLNPGFPEELKSKDSAETKVNIKLVKSGDSKDKDKEFLSAGIPSTSETLENKDVESSTSTSIEVSVKDLEVESGSPEEQKPERRAETNNPSCSATAIDSGTEVVGSSSHEDKSSGVADVVEKNNEGFEEVLQTTTRFPEDLTAISVEQTQPHAAEAVDENAEGIKEEVMQTTTKLPVDFKVRSEVDETIFYENKVSQGATVDNNEAVEDGVETSTVLDVVPPVANVSSECEKGFEPGVMFQEREDETLEGDGNITVPKVSEVSAEVSVLEKDNSVDKKKDVNVESTERGLSETSRDIILAEVSTDEVKAPENAEESLELRSLDLIVSPESSEDPSAVDRIFVSNEKNESLKGEHSTLVESPKDIPASDESPDQLIEKKKNKFSKSGTDASVELVPLASEAYKEEKDETHKDASLKEKTVNIPVDKEEEKVEDIVENIKDKPNQEGLAENKGREKTRDLHQIVSSDTGAAKLIKEASKRRSSIFSKVKHWIIKAKKTILGKSPGPKTLSSEAKD